MRIGLLLPNSGYYPYIGSDLYNSLKLTLGETYKYILKDTNFATPADNQKAVKELVLYDNVDFIVGFFGYRSITAVKPLIQQTKTPLIICNSGEHPLLEADVSPYIVHLSLGMFNSTYLACKWAFNKIGKSFASLHAFFEAGYPILYAADIASKCYHGNIECLEITHKNNDNILPAEIEKIERGNSDFILMAYHGFQALDVSKYIYKNKSLNGKPLVVSPFFFEPEILDTGIDNPLITVKTWTYTPNDISVNLKQHFERELNRQPSLFAILGFEAASAIKHCLNAGWKTKEEIAPYLTDCKIQSSRGELPFDTEMNNFKCNYYLQRTHSENNDPLTEELKVRIIVPDVVDEENLNGIDKEISGWTNTYLCK